MPAGEPVERNPSLDLALASRTTTHQFPTPAGARRFLLPRPVDDSGQSIGFSSVFTTYNQRAREWPVVGIPWRRTPPMLKDLSYDSMM